MLSILATGLIVGFTLVLFFLTVFIPIRFNVKAWFNTPDDHFISSRKTQSWWSIGLSLYATAVGTWSLTAPAETGVYAGWWGILGYAIAAGCAWIVFFWSGAVLRKLMESTGYTSLEFVLERYGRPMHIIVTLMSVIYLALLLISELTALAAAITILSPDFPPLAVILAVSIVTNIYSALGGFPASMVTDKLQGILTILLIVICYGVVFGDVKPHIDSESWHQANDWPSSGIPTALVLILACFIVEQINQATWQRVFAARTERDMYWGFGLGMILMTPSMILFGLSGVFAKAANFSGYIQLDEYAAYEAMFLLLAKLPSFWLGVVLFLLIGLVTSTADTVQTGLAATIAGELLKHKKSLGWARVFSVLLNVPAVVLAVYNPPSILLIMMFGNIITVAIVPVVLLGFTPYVTSLGALFGVIAGLLTIFIYGWSITGNFIDGLEWPTFPQGYDWHCFFTFIAVIAACMGVALAVSRFQQWRDPQIYGKLRDLLAAIQTRDSQKGENPLVDGKDVDEVTSAAGRSMDKSSFAASRDDSLVKADHSKNPASP